MKKKNNKHGFTLAELLIVVAIIAVLTAIAIPVFSAQLEKSRDATDEANVRSAIAEATVAYLDSDESGDVTFAYNINGKGTNATWDNVDGKPGTVDIGGVQVQAVTKGKSVSIVMGVDGIKSATINTAAVSTEGKQST